ncbi:hypothetical protein A2U01_0018181, partial [Trifolium medium]|nr:hypothetical protein [Trifolium medium]
SLPLTPSSYTVTVVTIPWKNSARSEFNIIKLKTNKRDENQHLNTEGFRNKEISKDNKRNKGKKNEATEETSGFNSNKHEVRKRATKNEKSSVEIGGNGFTRKSSVAFGYRREVTFQLHFSFDGAILCYGGDNVYSFLESVRDEGDERWV